MTSNNFWREVDVLEGLKHDRIPDYLGHFVIERDGRLLLCLVVEYIEGDSLLEVMKTSRWTLHESLQVVHQLINSCLFAIVTTLNFTS